MTREEAIKRINDIRKIYARYVEIVTENENEALDMAIKALEPNNEQWQELKETITEMRDNDGTCTQQEVCKFLVNYMNVLEKQMQEPKIGHWIFDDECHEHGHCSECGYGSVDLVDGEPHHFCRKCGAKMVEMQEG